MRCKHCNNKVKDWEYKTVFQTKSGKWVQLICPHCQRVNHFEKFKKLKLK
jgi:phage FluMu protein Com